MAQFGFVFKADAGMLGSKHLACVQLSAVSKSTKWRKTERIDFDSAEPKTLGYMERKQMTSVRPKRGAWPSFLQQACDDSQISWNSVAMYGIEKQEVTLTVETPVKIQ